MASNRQEVAAKLVFLNEKVRAAFMCFLIPSFSETQGWAMTETELR